MLSLLILHTHSMKHSNLLVRNVGSESFKQHIVKELISIESEVQLRHLSASRTWTSKKSNMPTFLSQRSTLSFILINVGISHFEYMESCLLICHFCENTLIIPTLPEVWPVCIPCLEFSPFFPNLSLNFPLSRQSEQMAATWPLRCCSSLAPEAMLTEAQSLLCDTYGTKEPVTNDGMEWRWKTDLK